MPGDRADRLRARLEMAARPFGWVAVAALVFMMLLTTGAVAARALFGIEVFGVVDMMEMALAVCIFVALPGVFLRDEHITVGLVDSLRSKRLTFALRLIGLALSLGFVVVTLVEIVPPALDKYRYGEGTMTLQLPRWWQAIPIAVGYACSAVATIAVIWRLVRGGPARALELPSQDPD
jgi:TRAP-type C4-dicarboxylate transport system permease small subunit